MKLTKVMNFMNSIERIVAVVNNFALSERLAMRSVDEKRFESF